MGTINYKTSNIITLGTMPEDFDVIQIDYCEEHGFDPEEVSDEVVYEIINENELCDEVNANFIIDGCALCFFKLSVEPGYYEGRQIIIEENLPTWDGEFEREEDKKDVLAEIDKLEQLLIELNGIGFAVCHPWWCTTYEEYDKGCESIKNAIAEYKKSVTAIAVCA